MNQGFIVNFGNFGIYCSEGLLDEEALYNHLAERGLDAGTYAGNSGMPGYRI